MYGEEYKTIHYGIGKDYLKSWTIEDALREIYQNFIDYGDYEVNVKEIEDSNEVTVTITSDYTPESNEFLRIGYSHKPKENSIGKHGEGLKMAMFIFTREGLPFEIRTSNNLYNPVFVDNGGLGECLAVNVYDTDYNASNFTVSFDCNIDDFNRFNDNLLKEEDVIYSSNYHGSIVNKPAGNIYSGGMFVTNIDGVSGAYDIKPEHLSLDRDRRVPRDIDIAYHSSRLNQEYDKWTFKEQRYKDVDHINVIPDRLIKGIKVIKSGVNAIFTYNVSNEPQVVITNNNLIEAIKRNPIIAKQLIKVKKKARIKPHINCKTVVGALTKFSKSHGLSVEAQSDIKDIIARTKKGMLK